MRATSPSTLSADGSTRTNLVVRRRLRYLYPLGNRRVGTCHRRWQVEESEDTCTGKLHEHSVISKFIDSSANKAAHTRLLQLSHGPDVDDGGKIVIEARSPNTPEDESMFKVDPGITTLPGIVDQL